MVEKENPSTWADALAIRMMNRKNFYYLKEKPFICKEQNLKTATSISGIPHIGNAKDVIVTDTVAKALENMGIESTLYWIADDSDPFRKVPRSLDPKKYDQYVGMPVSAVPCPEECCESYVHHFVSLFIDSFKDLGIFPKVYSMSDLYQKGEFYDYIKTAIEKRDFLRDLLNEYRDSKLGEDWYPWSPICEKCNKMVTTTITSIEEDTIYYKCQGYEFKHRTVEGCGYDGNQNIKSGLGKLPYRTEAAVQWAYFKITFEPWGKEHATKPGGTLWVNGQISEHIFNWPMPEYLIYEFYLVDGEKMSSSIGNIITVNNWLKYAFPEHLKYLCIKKPKVQANIYHSNLPRYSDEFDELAKIYFSQKEFTKKIKKNLEQFRRIYEYCQKDKIPSSFPVESNIPYNIAAVVSQFYTKIDDFDELANIFEILNFDFKNISFEDKERIIKKIEISNNWINDYGPEKIKFTVLETIPDDFDLKLSANQETALVKISNFFDNDDILAKDINAKIHEIAKDNNLKPMELFEPIYKLLIGKNSGPRLARFILMLKKYKGKKWLLNRLKYGQ